MIQRTNESNATQQMRQSAIHHRAPFWIPASNFYIFALAATVAIFFLLLGILHDGLDDLPWLIAGIGAIFAFGAAVFVREVLLRNARDRFVSEKRLDKRVRGLAGIGAKAQDKKKLSLEANERMLREIREKSDAAKVLVQFSEAHRTVVDLCEKYLAVAAEELANAGAGSPRIPAMRKGSRTVSGHHRYHMLKWAEIEAKSLTLDTESRDKIDQTLDRAERALDAVDHAMGSYPLEPRLIDSQYVLRNFITSVRVSTSVESAERELLNGDHDLAIDLYGAAARELRRYGHDEKRANAAAKIDLEIERLRELNGRG